MQEIINKIETLVREYEGELLEKGLICSISKKYFETKVQKPVHSYHHSLLDVLFRQMALKRESRNFHHQRNRTHSVVLKFIPVNSELVKKHECREYAFILSEISRPEVGFAPKAKIHKEEKILRKIEKRIRKILRKAEKKNAVEICKCTKADVIRYFFLKPYGYMKKLVGYDRDTLDIIFSALLIAAFLVIFITLSF